MSKYTYLPIPHILDETAIDIFIIEHDYYEACAETDAVIHELFHGAYEVSHG